MEAMGFRKHEPNFEFQCKAYWLKIYSIEGLEFLDKEDIYSDQVNENLSFSIGHDAKSTVLQLLKGDNVKNIEQIIEEKCKTGPYLATLASNNKEYNLKCKWLGFVEEDHYIVYYSLEEARIDLVECMAAYEIPFIAMASSIVSHRNQGTRLSRLASFIYGLTPDNKCVDDIRSNMSATIIAGNASSAKQCHERIMKGVRLSMPISKRVSKLYYLAMGEDDPVKKFIFSWTSLEVLINSTFDTIKSSTIIFPDLGEDSPFRESVNNLFRDKNRGRIVTSIAQKYLFLSCFFWKQLNVDDYDLFSQCKKVRDKFNHGSEIDLSSLPVNKLTYLLDKILASLCDEGLMVEDKQ
jgi:hypothetical protein